MPSLYAVNIHIPLDIDIGDFESFLDALDVLLLGTQTLICGGFNCPSFPNGDDSKTIIISQFMSFLYL